MHPSEKGHQGHFGIKAHIGVAAGSGPKLRYRRLKKNTAQLNALFALANLL